VVESMPQAGPVVIRAHTHRHTQVGERYGSAM